LHSKSAVIPTRLYAAAPSNTGSNSFSSFSLEKISQKELLMAMNNLALGYKTVLNLYAIEGYSHAEIAEMMGISEGTSKSQLSRARVAFAAELKKLNIHIEKDR
jgi:RNA polymerase sigma factor (sigma-70 family)